MTLDLPEDLTYDVAHVPGNRRASQRTSWSDVFPISPARVLVFIGECIDTGPAALPARRLREMLAFATGPELETAAVLRSAVRLLCDDATTAPATAVVAIVDFVLQRFTYVCAGQAPPLIRYHDGTVSALPVDAPARGDDRPLAQTTVDLAGAAQIVLYTSELVHAPGADGGVARLARILGDDRLRHSARPGAWLSRRMLANASHDDVTLLVLRFTARQAPSRRGHLPAWKSAWTFDATAASSNLARRAFMAHLQSKPDRGATVDSSLAELIFGELLGNVVRHAPGLVQVELDWTQDAPVLHVLDNGPGFQSRRQQERLPDDNLSESGRGLFIISACATNFMIRNRDTGGTHATAILPNLQSAAV